jgi:hypothetical protein
MTTFYFNCFCFLPYNQAAAKAQYQAAVSQGKQAAFLEQTAKDDVFRCALGNLSPGERVTVSLSMALTLPAVSGRSGHARVVGLFVVVCYV